MRKYLLPLLAILLCAPLFVGAATLRDGHPERYTVQKGDTLWDISGRFLRSPWLWPEIWHKNPEIANPHLIYPGDVISLVYIDGEPRLTVQRDDRSGAVRTVRLGPQVREESVTEAVHSIPLSAIRPFLSRTRVVEPGELDQAAYILAGADERVMGSQTDRIYVRGLDADAANGTYAVLRQGDVFTDPDTNAVLGLAATHLGDAKLVREGDPASFDIVRANREILPGDRLLPATDTAFGSNFYPKAPNTEVEGQIIAVMDGVTQIGQYSIVALNRGQSHELEVGDVLSIYKAGEVVRDRFSGKRRDSVQLPDELAGQLIVFRTFEQMSFGLVMKAEKAMHVSDRVRNP